MKNKEERNRKHLIGWGHVVIFIWCETPRVGLESGDWPTEYIAFLVKSTYNGTKVI